MVDLSSLIVPEDAVPKPMVTCVIEGILEESDLRELALSAEDKAAQPIMEIDDPADLKKVREKHHSVARMIAGGLTQRMVAKLCGYNETYLSVLLNNPAMQELIELYRVQHGAAQQLVIEKLATVGLKALEKLDEDLDAGNLSKQEKLSLAKLGLDRGGFGPQSKQHIVSEKHVFDHTEIEKRNNAARARSASRIVPSSEIRAALAPPASEQEVEGEATREMGPEGQGLPEDRE